MSAVSGVTVLRHPAEIQLRRLKFDRAFEAAAMPTKRSSATSPA